MVRGKKILDNPHARREVALRVVRDAILPPDETDDPRDNLVKDMLGGRTEVRLKVPLMNVSDLLRHVEVIQDDFTMLLMALREEARRPGCRPVDLLCLAQRRISVLNKRINAYRRLR